MLFKSILPLAAFVATALAMPAGEIFERAIGSSCTASAGTGTCQLTTNCVTNGFSVTGACPNDPSTVRCCIKKTCSVSGVGSGTCLNSSSGCSGGSFYSGACPGDSTIKCCIKGATSTPTPATFTGAQVLAKAKTQEGVWYSWGGGGCNGKSKGIDSGANTTGFDCSGLTQYAVCQASGSKVVIPRTTKYQYGSGTKIAKSKMAIGDLIFYATGGDCSCDSSGYCKNMYHVAIYAGNNEMYEARKTDTQITTTDLRTFEMCPNVVRYW